jgi:Endonuclease related to archaeal Holliday junction resolvase
LIGSAKERRALQPIQLPAHYPRGAQVEIVFVDVKTGGSSLSPRQRLIRDAIEDGRVRFEVFRFRPEEAASIVTATDEEITVTEEELIGECVLDEVVDLDKAYPEDGPLMTQ